MNNLPECGHFVNCLPATKTTGATNLTGDLFSLSLYDHADIAISFGSTAATNTIKVYECRDAVAASATAIAFDYYAETTTAGDTLSIAASVTSTGLVSTGNDCTMYIISIDADQLSNGYPWVRLNVNTGGANALSAFAILTGSRYGGQTTPTAIE